MKLKKWLVRIAFVLAALVTLGALTLAIENYRGKRAWERCRAEYKAQGEELDWLALLPKPIADQDNLMMTPLLAPCLDYEVDPVTQAARLKDTNAVRRVTDQFLWAVTLRAGNWSQGTVADLNAWQAEVRSNTNVVDPAWRALLARPMGKPLDDLRFLLDAHRPALDELRAAARRPGANLKVPYDDAFGVMMSQLGLLKSLTYPFKAAAIGELAGGEPAAACEDILALLAVTEVLAQEPLLIAGLVRIAMLEVTLGPIWNGLAQRQWQEPQLAALEERLSRLNAVADTVRVLRGERGFFLAALGALPINPVENHPGRALSLGRAYRHLPAAMIYQNQVNGARAFQTGLFPLFDPAGWRMKLPPVEDEDAFQRQFLAPYASRHPYRALANLTMPAIARVALKTARHQANLSLARVAIALERHRLALGQYPERLDELAPRFVAKLPPDPVNGEPFRYRREGTGQFLLYSIGLNQRDDGGRGAPSAKRGSPKQPADGDDWIWLSGPEKQ